MLEWGAKYKEKMLKSLNEAFFNKKDEDEDKKD